MKNFIKMVGQGVFLGILIITLGMIAVVGLKEKGINVPGVIRDICFLLSIFWGNYVFSRKPRGKKLWLLIVATTMAIIIIDILGVLIIICSGQLNLENLISSFRLPI